MEKYLKIGEEFLTTYGPSVLKSLGILIIG
jgi:hypothetical protein